MSNLEECVRSFDRLVPKAAELHSMTWCVKGQEARRTLTLEGRECCNCSHYILNGGICDPL
uniref:Uncharacterized protein n=1 Tax=viral metagenome TaxID=1070528 RepID=A0A6M3MAP8_9ZZZZ